jgi:uncharacterized membrane protein YjjB (DUF3815 family)
MAVPHVPGAATWALLLKMAAAVLLVDAFFILLPYLRKTLGYAFSFFGLVILATILMLFLQSLPARDLWIAGEIAAAGYAGVKLLLRCLKKTPRG